MEQDGKDVLNTHNMSFPKKIQVHRMMLTMETSSNVGSAMDSPDVKMVAMENQNKNSIDEMTKTMSQLRQKSEASKRLQPRLPSTAAVSSLGSGRRLPTASWRLRKDWVQRKIEIQGGAHFGEQATSGPKEVLAVKIHSRVDWKTTTED